MTKEMFIDFLLNAGALKLKNENDPEGLFTLKSGRRSPFFMNMGDLNSGSQLAALASAYAMAVATEFGKNVDVFFGPAYKGIPLAATAATAYYKERGGNARYCSDRKEIKDHGDVGSLLGAKLKPGDKVVIIEDVTTSGKSISEVMPKIKAAQPDINVVGLVVCLDRMERGASPDKTALEEISELYGIKATAIISMADVLNYKKDEIPLEKFRDYYAEYGVAGKEVILS